MDASVHERMLVTSSHERLHVGYTILFDDLVILKKTSF